MKNILKALIPMAFALVSLTPSLFAQDLDFRALDKLSASAKSTTNVTLAGPMRSVVYSGSTAYARFLRRYMAVSY